METVKEKSKASDKIQIRKNFSEVVQEELLKQGKSKRWLYYKLEMSPITLDSRLEFNDWRLGEIIRITQLLDIKNG